MLLGPVLVATMHGAAGAQGAPIDFALQPRQGAGDGRLRTQDWFLPRVSLAVQPATALTMTIDYGETLRAFGDTGVTGPMGMTRDDFDALRRTLKPETQSRFRLRADWAPTAALGVAMHVQSGRVDDRLNFTGRGTLPLNSGSAQINAIVLDARHRTGPHLRSSLRYSAARVHVSGGAIVQEHSLALETRWEDGLWRASGRIARNSAPAFAAMHHRPLRVEAGIDYAVAIRGRQPLQLSLHMTDPDRLTSSAFILDDLSGPVRAADQARAMMASARYHW